MSGMIDQMAEAMCVHNGGHDFGIGGWSDDVGLHWAVYQCENCRTHRTWITARDTSSTDLRTGCLSGRCAVCVQALEHEQCLSGECWASDDTCEMAGIPQGRTKQW